MENTDVLFDRILQSIGDYGPYQKRFNFIYTFLLCLCGAMAYMNLILVMTIPDHWCHVPGMENTNYTIDEWRDMYLPKELDNRGKLAPSACKMYNMSIIKNGEPPTDNDILSCQYGYDYDHTWYISTVPTSHDWVCERELYVTNVYGAGRFGEVAGAFLLGQLGDYIGRRPVCLISMLFIIVGKTVSIFSSHIYILFLIANVFASFPSMTTMQSVLVISMEITKPEKRAMLAQMQNFGWCLSMMLMALICWAIPDWQIFMAITSLPLMLYIFTYKYILESPRWLASRGKLKQCLIELNKIAKVNGKTVDPELIRQLENSAREPEKIYGVMSTFSSWRLAKNTLMLIVQWVICALAYFTIILNSANLGGNPFLNFLWQSAIELPSYLIGKLLCDKLGRRYTGCGALILTVSMFVITIFTVRDENLVMVTSMLMVGAKFFVSMTFYVVTLQTMEIYPTSLRQTGMSLGITMASAFGTFGPYIVYLGTQIDARYPHIILAGLSVAGAISQLCLPETLYTNLPETLEEARIFGHNQSFFHIAKKRKSIVVPEEIKFINKS